MLSIKPGVHIHNLQPQMVVALIVANDVWKALGQDLVWTCCNEARHRQKSYHVLGYAIDFRSNYFSPHQKRAAAIKLREALGENYDVIAEDTHIHCEYDPPQLIV